MDIAVISDTHMPRGRRALPPTCVECLRAADLVVHAGDLVERVVLDELHALNPDVVAVAGNIDSRELRELLPATADVHVEGVRIAVEHDGGPRRGRLERLRRRHPGADAVVFGHSHIPLHERAPDGFQIFNPGSPTDRRRQPHHTMGMARLSAGSVSFTLLRLD